VFNNYLIICTNRLTLALNTEIRVDVLDFPCSVVDRLGHDADLLVTRETSEGKRTNLATVEIHLLSNEVRGPLKSQLLTITNKIIRPIVLYPTKGEN
jgi:hypothetical protein